MRILWLTNALVPQTAALLGVPGRQSAGWTESLLAGLLAMDEHELFVLSLGKDRRAGSSGRLRAETFPQVMWKTSPENEARFGEILADFRPDVIHVFGTEFPHTLSMLRAAEKQGLLDRTLVSIQGLCSIIAGHYLTGLPERSWRGKTLRDLLRRDSILKQQRVFALRGEFEIEALRLARHAAGRTEWDFACTRQIHPGIGYHLLDEGMREPFYEREWTLSACTRHTLFLPQSGYPVKGLHLALPALKILRRSYPDARLITTGSDPRQTGWRRNSYQKFLAGQIAQLGPDGAVIFAGTLSAERMCEQFLSAHTCLSASTIENSPNGVCEAMLLGVPTVSSMVGGVPSLLTQGRDGLLYQADAPYMLADCVARIWEDDALALRLSENARSRALLRHDRGRIQRQLTEIYRELSEVRA